VTAFTGYRLRGYTESGILSRIRLETAVSAASGTIDCEIVAWAVRDSGWADGRWPRFVGKTARWESRG